MRDRYRTGTARRARRQIAKTKPSIRLTRRRTVAFHRLTRRRTHTSAGIPCLRGTSVRGRAGFELGGLRLRSTPRGYMTSLKGKEKRTRRGPRGRRRLESASSRACVRAWLDWPNFRTPGAVIGLGRSQLIAHRSLIPTLPDISCR